MTERSSSGMRLDTLFAHVRDDLRAAGFEAAAREARALIVAVGDVRPEAFIATPELMIPEATVDRIHAALTRRRAGMPIGRIVGERSFYGRPFRLAAEVLEPRPDSEVLIDAVLEILRLEGRLDQPLRIVDVGTGSGCLLITLLAELPQATGLGVDLAHGALVQAAENARLNKVADRAQFALSDALDGVDSQYDVLISNPPYLRRDEMSGLDRAVKDHDPPLALDGGIDGLDVYRRIGRRIPVVVPDGWIFLEIGAGMADSVCRTVEEESHLSPERGWRMWRDLNGHIRCVAAKTLNN